MNKLRVLLVTLALLTAACGGAATISGSQVKSVTNASNVRVDPGANAGVDVSGGTDSDLGRVNPTIRKGPGGPVPVQQSLSPTTNGTVPSNSGHDRCTDGIGGNVGIAPRAGSPGGKHPPLPQCAVQ